MRKTISFLKQARFSLSAAILLSAFGHAMAQVSVTTYHNDCMRTGLNSNETILNPANVRPKTFGLLFTHPVDGQIYAQPLYLAAVNVPGKGVHNLVYVATEHNSVYAFDADSNTGANAAPIWSVNLGPSVPSLDTRSLLVSPEKGITGTPVIVTGPSPTLYVVSFTKTIGKGGQPNYAQTLHALDVATGAEKLGGPRVIQGSVPGTGDGSVNGTLAFNPLWQMQRSALLYMPYKTSSSQPALVKGRLAPATSVSGTIYVAFGSHGDVFACHGWVFAYDAANLNLLGVLCTSPNAKTDSSGYPIAGGTIWQGGSGPATDGTNIFFSTGNGMFNPGNGSYGDSIVSFQDRVMQVKDYFTPSNQESLNDYDTDLGSGGVMLLPKEAGALGGPNLLIQTGKEGTTYLLNRDNLGGYGKTDHVVQELPHALGAIRGAPAYFNGNVYFGCSLSKMVALQLKNGALASTGITSQTSTTFMNTGAVPSVSANGKTNGIVWALQGVGKLGTVPGILHAYDANNLAVELYNSSTTNGRDTIDTSTKFSTPTVANGRVFVGGAGSFSTFGLGTWASAPSIRTASGMYAADTTVTIAKPQDGQYVTYTLDGTIPSANSTKYTGPFVLSSSASLRARTFGAGIGASEVSSAEYLIKPEVGTGTGLLAKYLDGNGSVPVASRVDQSINFEMNGGAPVQGVNPQSWSVTWTGALLPAVTGVYTLSTSASSGVTLWIDGKQIFDNSTFCEEPEDSGKIWLTAGKKVSIMIKYAHYGTSEPVGIYWLAPGIPKQIIPTSQMYPSN